MSIKPRQPITRGLGKVKKNVKYVSMLIPPSDPPPPPPYCYFFLLRFWIIGVV